MMSIELNYKLWLEENEKVFGPGPARILELVEESGSLQGAAAEMNMSYSQAWHLIQDLEERLGFSLLESRAGGKSGGGSQLTGEGRALLRRFRSFESEAGTELERLASEHFSQDFFADLRG